MSFGEKLRNWFGGGEKTEPELEETAKKAKEEKTWDVTRQPELEKNIGEKSITPEKFNEIADKAVARLKLSEEREKELANKLKADKGLMEGLIKSAAEKSEGSDKPTEEVLEDSIVDYFEKAFADEAKVRIEDDKA